MLIRGEKGTAKSTAVRGLAGCWEADPATRPGGTAHRRHRGPGGRVAGPAEGAADGEHAFSPGLLSRAHGGVLYVDEVNLLHDHLVDIMLDAAAMGRVHIERDGSRIRTRRASC